MSKTWTNRSAQRWAGPRKQEFRCRHCRAFVGVLPSGGRHRNHCPFCLFSRHVDRSVPGDRASECGGSLAPVGTLRRLNGEHVIVHACHGCGIERHCRVAADDDFALVLQLPELEPATSRQVAEELEQIA